ncbi:YciI family protein [Nocardioides sp. CER19]|uniref:YciI family protein n=1 Tax=Nocardioides sp. CER19 TaxID=3038538 RepID=UPI0024479822|nr:YciI family protein [Nocardioides sp. CER19]MDH2414280.1 YciI family protein [Nocardioides sp. CER19]
MATFAVTYVYSPDTEALDRLRPEHRAFLAAQDGLQLSGPTDDNGALLIFEAKSAAEIEELLDDDPFWNADLITERSVVGWNPVLGSWRDSLDL